MFHSNKQPQFNAADAAQETDSVLSGSPSSGMSWRDCSFAPLNLQFNWNTFFTDKHCYQTNELSPLKICFVYRWVYPGATPLSNDCLPCCVWSATCRSNQPSKPETRCFDKYKSENNQLFRNVLARGALKPWYLSAETLESELRITREQQAGETLHQGPIYIVTPSRWSLRGVTSGGDLYWAFWNDVHIYLNIIFTFILCCPPKAWNSWEHANHSTKGRRKGLWLWLWQ